MRADHPDCSLPPPEIESEYSPSSMVGGSALPFVRGYEERSAAASMQLGDRVEVVAGGSRLVRASDDAPLFVFVHGGYWQALSAADSMYLAPPVLERGWSYAAVEYTIAPGGSVDTMIDECRSALCALVDAVGAPGASGASTPIVVAGHSAGAHLVAMSLLAAAPPCVVERVILVSGVFDLRPVQMMSVNDALGWSVDDAVRLSPGLLEVRGHSDVLLMWGGHDTSAFARQSRSYADVLRAAGIAVTESERPGRHHFDILDDLASLLPRSGS